MLGMSNGIWCSDPYYPSMFADIGIDVGGKTHTYTPKERGEGKREQTKEPSNDYQNIDYMLYISYISLLGFP
jgi:hypothetical protein